MGVLRDRIGSRQPPRRSAASAVPPAPPAPAGARSAASAQQPPVAGAPPPGGPGSELRRRRDALAEEVTELHWDLGGLAYEMAIRDHFRLDVLVRRAAILQERDAQLAEVERLLATEEEGAAGSCPNCRAPHSRGAVYCWQCGTTLMQRLPSETVAVSQAPAAVMDALLAPPAPADGSH